MRTAVLALMRPHPVIWSQPGAVTKRWEAGRSGPGGVGKTAVAIEPWSFSGGSYANYMTGDEPLERVRAAFGAESFERLQVLKRRYDPTNVLRRNQNIPPGGEDESHR